MNEDVSGLYVFFAAPCPARFAAAASAKPAAASRARDLFSLRLARAPWSRQSIPDQHDRLTRRPHQFGIA